MQVTQQDAILVLCQIGLFLVLFAILKRLWFSPVATVLHERQHRSEGALAEAREIQARAEELRAEHARALDEARAEARREVQDLWRASEAEQQRMIEAAHADAERTLEAAREQIARDVGQAQKDLDGQVRQIARQAAESVLGRSIG
jgi:F0F1-type ATP synthase membrane subunit b/b'